MECKWRGTTVVNINSKTVPSVNGRIDIPHPSKQQIHSETEFHWHFNSGKMTRKYILYNNKKYKTKTKAMEQVDTPMNARTRLSK